MRFFYVRFVYVSFKGARTAFPPPATERADTGWGGKKTAKKHPLSRNYQSNMHAHRSFTTPRPCLRAAFHGCGRLVCRGASPIV